MCDTQGLAKPGPVPAVVYTRDAGRYVFTGGSAVTRANTQDGNPDGSRHHRDRLDPDGRNGLGPVIRLPGGTGFRQAAAVRCLRG